MSSLPDCCSEVFLLLVLHPSIPPVRLLGPPLRRIQSPYVLVLSSWLLTPECGQKSLLTVLLRCRPFPFVSPQLLPPSTSDPGRRFFLSLPRPSVGTPNYCNLSCTLYSHVSISKFDSEFHSSDPVLERVPRWQSFPLWPCLDNLRPQVHGRGKGREFTNFRRGRDGWSGVRMSLSWHYLTTQLIDI